MDCILALSTAQTDIVVSIGTIAELLLKLERDANIHWSKLQSVLDRARVLGYDWSEVLQGDGCRQV